MVTDEQGKREEMNPRTKGYSGEEEGTSKLWVCLRVSDYLSLLSPHPVTQSHSSSIHCSAPSASSQVSPGLTPAVLASIVFQFQRTSTQAIFILNSWCKPVAKQSQHNRNNKGSEADRVCTTSPTCCLPSRGPGSSLRCGEVMLRSAFCFLFLHEAASKRVLMSVLL